jgi:Domain of Unknown function (DUF542)
MTFDVSQTVGEIASENPTAGRVFENFGIDYCCGGKRPLQEACESVNVLSLSSGTLLVYQLPEGVDVDSLRFEVRDLNLSLIDGKGFTMNLTEHTHAGQI